MYKTIHRYEYVTHDKTVSYENGQKLRFIIYGAYNAFGLIGTELNGIAILDENRMSVVCDEINKLPSWAYNPSNLQTPKQLVNEFKKLTSMSWQEIQKFINSHPRSRYTI
jgi:hypothetical protein